MSEKVGGTVMTGHETILTRLSDYLDGTLTDSEREEIRCHLETCQGCAAEYHDLRRAVQLVRGLEPVVPPPWLAGRIMGRIRRETPFRRRIADRLRRSLRSGIPIQAAALLLVSIGSYYLFQRQAEQGLVPSSPPPLRESAPRAAPATAGKPAVPPKASPAPRTAGATPEKKGPAVPSPAAPRPIEKSLIPEPVAEPASAPAAPPPPEALYERAAPAAAETADKREQAFGAATGKAAPAPALKKRSTGDRVAPISLTIAVTDVEAAFSATEKIVREQGGRVMRVVRDEERIVLYAATSSAGPAAVIERLRGLGMVEAPPETGSGTTEIAIILRKE